MPRVSRQQTEKNRAAIEETSARLFRERGWDGVSVADLMASVGLTHGGFYGHYESKSALVAAACARAFDEVSQRWNARTRGQSRREALQTFVDAYLDAGHRDHPGRGCPAAALAVDVAREPPDEPVRHAYATGVRSMAARLAAMAPTDEAAAAQRRALAQAATLVGALLLARATRGDAISDQILAAARASLLDQQELRE